MVVFVSFNVNAFLTSSTKFSGTIILLIAVHFCPALTVISFNTSFIKISNSAVPGTESSPKTEQFNESASILNGTAFSTIFG